MHGRHVPPHWGRSLKKKSHLKKLSWLLVAKRRGLLWQGNVAAVAAAVVVAVAAVVVVACWGA